MLWYKPKGTKKIKELNIEEAIMLSRKTNPKIECGKERDSKSVNLIKEKKEQRRVIGRDLSSCVCFYHSFAIKVLWASAEFLIFGTFMFFNIINSFRRKQNKMKRIDSIKWLTNKQYEKQSKMRGSFPFPN